MAQYQEYPNSLNIRQEITYWIIYYQQPHNPAPSAGGLWAWLE